MASSSDGQSFPPPVSSQDEGCAPQVQAHAPPPHPDMVIWRRRVEDWYPDLDKQTYFLPPLFFNRQHHEVQPVAGRAVPVLQPPEAGRPNGTAPPFLESDVRDDTCQRRVLHCFQQLAERLKEVMFVISQLNYKHYLGEPCYSAAAGLLPRPVDLKEVKKDRGDFDLLIVHRFYGLMVGEIKAVGDMFSSLSTSEQKQDIIVAKRVQRAIEQLRKSDDVLRHLVSDQPVPPKISETVMLPNISMSQLQRVLDRDPQLRHDLCQCVGVATSEDPSTLCFTSDGLNKPDQWWAEWVKVIGKDPAMTSEVYLDLVSRFSGPATTVGVYTSSLPDLAHHAHLRTPGQAVWETGWRFTNIVLYPSQVGILHSSLSCVFLTGPPGTGKTLMLVLKALDWLRQGADVHVVSTWAGSLAASVMIVHQVKHLAEASARQRIQLHRCDLKVGQGDVPAEVTKQVEMFLRKAQGRRLHVIIDEACSGSGFRDFCTQLHRRAHRMCLWSASVFNGHCPPDLTTIVLTEPLRSPPSVTQVVEGSKYINQKCDVYGYSPPSSPPAADGPDPLLVIHKGEGHTGVDPRDCEQCGSQVGRVLLEVLHIGQSGHGDSSGPPALRFHDVFLLSDFVDGFRDTSTDDRGNELQPACGMVRALRQLGVPVTVLRFGDVDAITRVVNQEMDRVVAAGCDSVFGLERRVIVWVDQGISGLGTLYAPSRSTAQLVWVKL